MLILVFLTLNNMRVVLQEEVVQVFGDEGRHAGVCQGCEEFETSMKGNQKGRNKRLNSGIEMTFSPSLLKFK